MKIMIFITLLFVSVIAFSQAPVTAPVSTTTTTVPSTVLADTIKNLPLILLILKSIADLIFAINPKADAPGGVIDAAYTWLKNKVQSQQGVQK